jgi:hypothetical protein
MSDFTTNFVFSKGVSWEVPKENEAIVPEILDRVWKEDNDEPTLLWELGQNGSVTGDVFIKVAYEEAWTDSAGNTHPGRVRILPINPSFAFPEWHPHDRDRMIRFKLKYRFWGTTLDGTRQVFTYVELITDDFIEEYINDELISSHPNPLGEIPIVHIPNLPIASSPWGMSDIQDIISLNRQYNETASALADIINYHAAPTTVIVGAKMSQMEKGARKVWHGLPKDAQVYNLEMASDATLAQSFMSLLKQAMHEMTGIPISALGQEQAVSNTSGVALQIQYQPMMMKFHEKAGTYGKGFAKTNELVLKTLALKEPELFVYDPSVDPPLKEGQLPILDLRDPNTYKSRARFQTPLPIDRLIVLNEIMASMQLGLESKRGALLKLGEVMPDEKLEELQDELMDDAKRQGALDLLRAEISDVIMMLTMSGAAMAGGPTGAMAPAGGTAAGTPSKDTGGNVASAGGSDVNTATGPSGSTTQNAALPGIQPNADTESIMKEMSTLAMGTKIPQRRIPNSDNE